jgi:hypothetical protein
VKVVGGTKYLLYPLPFLGKKSNLRKGGNIWNIDNKGKR